jgi:hypothetical protein
MPVRSKPMVNNQVVKERPGLRERVAALQERLPVQPPRTPQPEPPQQPKGGGGWLRFYQKGRAVAALVAFLLLFSALWWLNGHFTALTVVALFLGARYAQGWVVHIVLTLIELSLPTIRPYLRGAPFIVYAILLLVLVVVGALDVGSSAVVVMALATRFGVTLGPIAATLIALPIAVVPEIVIISLAVAIWRALR